MSTLNNKELTAEDAANMLKVHSRTIRNMIAKKEIRGKKVGGKWFVDKSSLKKWQTEPGPGNTAKPSNKAPNDLRRLAAYRLCVHAFEAFNWSHKNPGLSAYLENQRITVISEIGAGFYSFGKYKNECYVKARYSLGSIVALLEAFPEESLTKAKEFIGSECLSAMGNLIRKLEKNREIRS